MSLFGLFSRKQDNSSKSAEVAKERLRVIVDYERDQRRILPYLPKLQEEIVDVIKRYVDIHPDDIDIQFADQEGRARLEVNIHLSSDKS